MRKRPDRDLEERKFIEKAEASAADQATISEDLHKYMHKINWPLDAFPAAPSMAEGSTLRKPMTLALTEKEWNSIDRHTKALGISKTEWIRHALFKLMQEEQIYCFKNKG